MKTPTGRFVTTSIHANQPNHPTIRFDFHVPMASRVHSSQQISKDFQKAFQTPQSCREEPTGMEGPFFLRALSGCSSTAVVSALNHQSHQRQPALYLVLHQAPTISLTELSCMYRILHFLPFIHLFGANSSLGAGSGADLCVGRAL